MRGVDFGLLFGPFTSEDHHQSGPDLGELPAPVLELCIRTYALHVCSGKLARQNSKGPYALKNERTDREVSHQLKQNIHPRIQLDDQSLSTASAEGLEC